MHPTCKALTHLACLQEVHHAAAYCQYGDYSAVWNRFVTPSNRQQNKLQSRQGSAVMCAACAVMLSSASGAGVDAVDLDKCEGLWGVVSTVLPGLLQHESLLKSAIMRRPQEDFSIQAACHSCVCLHRAQHEARACSEQASSKPCVKHIMSAVHSAL
jgi:hypothetical protein